jgi:hypothetical protein
MTGNVPRLNGFVLSLYTQDYNLWREYLNHMECYNQINLYYLYLRLLVNQVNHIITC